MHVIWLLFTFRASCNLGLACLCSPESVGMVADKHSPLGKHTWALVDFCLSSTSPGVGWGGGGYRDEGNLVHVVSWVLTWFLKPPVSNFSKLLCIDISAQVMGMCVNEISGEWSCSFGAQYTNDFHMHQQVCVVFSAFTLLGKYALFVTSNFTPTR